MPGFLTDRQIRTRLQAGELIDAGTWEVASLRHASYTLRVGSRVEIEKASQSRDTQRQRVAITLRAGGQPLELHPGDTALIYSMEQLTCRVSSDQSLLEDGPGLVS
jgi:endonuclease IV